MKSEQILASALSNSDDLSFLTALQSEIATEMISVTTAISSVNSAHQEASRLFSDELSVEVERIEELIEDSQTALVEAEEANT